MDQISSYATLQSAVAGMIHRPNDTNITGNAPLFIQLCEADLNDRLLLKDMESDESLTLTLNQNYVALPSGFVSPIAMWLVVDSERVPLNPALPQELPYSTSATQPNWYAIDGANIRFDCPAGSAYSAFLRCIKKSNLSVSNTSNALLLRRPDVYLYGTLMQASIFIGGNSPGAEDAAAIAKWSGLYERAVKGLKAADHRSRAIVPMRTDIPSSRRSGSILRGE
jgi:hypothetical protein